MMNGEWIGAKKKRCPWVDALLGYGARAAFQPAGGLLLGPSCRVQPAHLSSGPAHLQLKKT